METFYKSSQLTDSVESRRFRSDRERANANNIRHKFNGYQVVGVNNTLVLMWMNYVVVIWVEMRRCRASYRFWKGTSLKVPCSTSATSVDYKNEGKMNVIGSDLLIVLIQANFDDAQQRQPEFSNPKTIRLRRRLLLVPLSVLELIDFVWTYIF